MSGISDYLGADDPCPAGLCAARRGHRDRARAAHHLAAALRRTVRAHRRHPGLSGRRLQAAPRPRQVLVMTAFFVRVLNGMATIEDLDRGVIDRFLVSPVGRLPLILVGERRRLPRAARGVRGRLPGDGDEGVRLLPEAGAERRGEGYVTALRGIRVLRDVPLRATPARAPPGHGATTRATTRPGPPLRCRSSWDWAPPASRGSDPSAAYARALDTNRSRPGASGTSTRLAYSAPPRSMSARSGSHERPNWRRSCARQQPDRDEVHELEHRALGQRRPAGA